MLNDEEVHADWGRLDTTMIQHETKEDTSLNKAHLSVQTEDQILAAQEEARTTLPGSRRTSTISSDVALNYAITARAKTKVDPWSPRLFSRMAS